MAKVTTSSTVKPAMLKKENNPQDAPAKKRTGAVNKNNLLLALNAVESNFYEALKKVTQISVDTINAAEKEYAQGEEKIASAKNALTIARAKVTEFKDKLLRTKTEAVKQLLKRAEVDVDQIQTELDTFTTQVVLSKDAVKRAKGLIKKFAALEKTIKKFDTEYGNGYHEIDKPSATPTKTAQKGKKPAKPGSEKHTTAKVQGNAQKVANDLFTEMSAGTVNPRTSQDE